MLACELRKDSEVVGAVRPVCMSDVVRAVVCQNFVGERFSPHSSIPNFTSQLGYVDSSFVASCLPNLIFDVFKEQPNLSSCAQCDCHAMYIHLRLNFAFLYPAFKILQDGP